MSDNANEPVNNDQTQSAQPENAPASQPQEPRAEQPASWQAPEQQSAQGSAPQQPAAQQPEAPQQAPHQAPRWGEYAPQQPGQPAQPAQPTQAQPTQQYPNGYGQNPAGYPQGYQHTQPTQPIGGQQHAPQQPQHPYYAQFTSQQPLQVPPQQYGQPGQPGQPGRPGQPNPEKPRGERTLTGKSIAIIAAALVVGGLLGGGIGGGIAAVASHNGGTPVSVSGGGSGASNITVQDPKDATQVTAVAAKASNSVVTINVTGQQESGTGSGVILTDDGYILTNTHVVTLDGDESDGQIQVQTNDGSLYTAKVVGTDPTDDLAVIKLNNAKGLTPINWGDSDKLNVGDQVIAIGAPLGLQGTVTDGIVSALNRSVTLDSSAPKQTGGSDDDQNPFGGGFGGSNPFDQGQQSATSDSIFVPAIQTDAAINPGNSGGALLNDKGELVGINVAIASTGSSDDSTSQSGNIGVGFAIPASVAHRIADELKSNGKATHGLLGATVSNAAAQTDATTVGARIESVNSGSAASSAGLKAGDVVTKVGGVPITSSDDLTAQVRSAASGSTIKVTYVRDGKTYQADVTLGTYSPKS